MDISKDQQRAALHATIHDLLTPTWLRWTLGVVVTATLVLMVASPLVHSPNVGRARDVGMVASMLLCGYWLLRALWLSRQVTREPRELSVKAAALALRRAGIDEQPRQVRAAMFGGPWDGDVVPLLLPGSGPWPESVCPRVDGVSQHYRLERVGDATAATYLYVGECVSGAGDVWPRDVS